MSPVTMISRCPTCSAELACEYCPRCGQRRIHPEDLSARHYFRELAVVCAALFFLSAPMAGFTLASMMVADESGTLSRLVSARAVERGLDTPLFNARFDVRVQSVSTITLGVVALVFAVMLQWLFRKQNRPYGAHLIFGLHDIDRCHPVESRGPPPSHDRSQ